MATSDKDTFHHKDNHKLKVLAKNAYFSLIVKSHPPPQDALVFFSIHSITEINYIHNGHFLCSRLAS